MKGKTSRPTAGVCCNKHINHSLCTYIQSHPLARSRIGQSLRLNPRGPGQKAARNNKLELRQSPGGNTWCQIRICHCFEGTWMEEGINVCVFEDPFLHTIRPDLIFPDSSPLPQDYLFLIFTLMVTFISRLASRVSLMLRIFLKIINIWNNKTSSRGL